MFLHNSVRCLAKCTASLLLLCFCFATPSYSQTESFPTQSRYVDRQTGIPVVAPNSRQLVNPISGQSTFNGFNRTLTDTTTGQSTFNGYCIKLTDPNTGAPTFKGYGQNPLMQNRQSAPDFKWNSNVDSSGNSQYSGFGRAPLTTGDGHSTFIGNNRKLTNESGASTFVGNNRQLADPNGRQDFLKQSQPIHVIPGRQSYLNGRAFPRLPQSAPPTVPGEVNPQLSGPASVGGTESNEIEPAATNSTTPREQENRRTTTAGKSENPPATSPPTEGGSGF